MSSNGYDFTRFSSLVNFNTNVNVEDKSLNNNKITIIGNGWGNSTTISSRYDLRMIHPQHILTRSADINVLKLNNQIMIKYNQFDITNDDDSSISIDLENSNNFNSNFNTVSSSTSLSKPLVNTILNNNKNPSSLTIKPVIYYYFKLLSLFFIKKNIIWVYLFN